MTGILVVLEGKDFSGKTKQREALAQVLRDAGHDVVLTREPGGTPFAEEVRELIFRQKDLVSAETELLMFQAARKDHMEKVIIPNCAAGKIVLCDRFYFSTYAYQVHPEVLKGKENILGLFGETLKFVLAEQPPVVQILLDVTPEELARRRDEVGERNSFDDMSQERADAISDAYEQFARSGELTVVDGNGDFDTITQNLRLIVESALVEVNQQVETEATAEAAQEAPAAPQLPEMNNFIEEVIGRTMASTNFADLMGEEKVALWTEIARERAKKLLVKLDTDNVQGHERYQHVAHGVQWVIQVGASSGLAIQFEQQAAEQRVATSADTPA